MCVCVKTINKKDHKFEKKSNEEYIGGFEGNKEKGGNGAFRGMY